MNRAAVAQDNKSENISPHSTGILQRKCTSCSNKTTAEGECSECANKKSKLQRKLSIGASNDPLEYEADRVADQVMSMSPGSNVASAAPSIQRASIPSNSSGTTAPASVDRVLASPGRPMRPALRQDMEQRFGHDFSQVRLHSGGMAEQSAQDVNAHAYTVGNNVVFAPGQFSPITNKGKRLLAHELTHVVQQSGGDASTTLRRADRNAVNRTISLGSVIGSGIQFSPTNVADTVVGSVSVRGGLLNSRASRLNVIVAENLTPRLLARQILPLWTTATPFTAPGAAAPVPLDVIDEETLAKGLLVYNQYYLPVPAMRRWQAGLNFPLPVEIDEATGIATLHPTLIRNLASIFNAAWMPLLDARVRATAVATPANLARDVTTFLTNEPAALGRGIYLGSRAQTNAAAELPFIREVFLQLGVNGFEVALSFMDYLVNREISLLAVQTDGAEILAIIGAALAPPLAITPEQQRRLDRANIMLGLVAGAAAQPTPTTMTTRPVKTITVDTLKLQGSTHTPSTDIAIANAVYSQCNIRVVHGVNAEAVPPQTATWLKGNANLSSSPFCNTVTAEERTLFSTASTAHGMASGASRYSVFYVETATGISASAYTCPSRLGRHGLFNNKIVIMNDASTDTLAHELGHHLITGGHPAGSIMDVRPRPTEITGHQCNLAYRRA